MVQKKAQISPLFEDFFNFALLFYKLQNLLQIVAIGVGGEFDLFTSCEIFSRKSVPKCDCASQCMHAYTHHLQAILLDSTNKSLFDVCDVILALVSVILRKLL